MNASTLTFTPAVRKRARLRIALAGPSGSGKTYGALLIAKGLGGKTAVIDTERNSASLYAHLTGFDALDLSPPYKPERFIEAIRAAEDAGYDNLVVDSITHEWNGIGGVLEIVDTIAKTSRSGNSYTAWNEATPRHRAFIDAMLQSRMNVIATMRTKAAYVIEAGSNGKQTPRKVGMAPEQRDGVEYEFTTVLDLSVDGNFASASKDRTGLFRDPVHITPEVGTRLRDWLESGEAPPEPMAEGAVADWLCRITECPTPAETAAARDGAYEAAKAAQDRGAARKFRDAAAAHVTKLIEGAANE